MARQCGDVLLHYIQNSEVALRNRLLQINAFICRSLQRKKGFAGKSITDTAAA